MSTARTDSNDYLQKLDQVITEVIAPEAEEVDRTGKFPREGVSALGRAGLLGLVSSNEVGGLGRVRGESLCESGESRFELAAENGGDAGVAEDALVQRGIEAVGAEVGPRVRSLDARQEAEEETGRRVHREVEGDQVGLFDGGARDLGTGEVGDGDAVSGGAQPCGGGGQPEGLPAELVGREENHPHPTIIGPLLNWN